MKTVRPAATNPTKPGSGTDEGCGAPTPDEIESLKERFSPLANVKTWPGAKVKEKKLISPKSPVTGSVVLKRWVSKSPAGMENAKVEGTEKLPLRETVPLAGAVPLRLPPSEAERI